MLRAISGQQDDHVCAQSWAAPDRSYQHAPSVALTTGLSGGATVTYDGDWVSRDGGTSWDADWEIIGREGRLLWSDGLAGDMSANLRLDLWGKPVESVPLPQLEALDRSGVLVEFRAGIAADRRPETNAADTIHGLAAMLAAVRSADSGELVRLFLLDAVHQS
jgi:predicted dehydrogenase